MRYNVGSLGYGVCIWSIGCDMRYGGEQNPMGPRNHVLLMSCLCEGKGQERIVKE